MSQYLQFLFGVLSFTTLVANFSVSCENDGAAKVVQLNVGESTGEKRSLRLTQPDYSVLHPELKVISLVRDNDHEQEVHLADVWTPSKRELQAAERNLYVDAENVAAVRLDWNPETQEHVLVSGVINGRNIRSSSGNEEGSGRNRSDYIDFGRTITPARRRQGNSPSVVEVALICDKEFGDIFNHDRRRILDYWTVYFWDVNLRYKTLPSSSISFRITSIVIINSPSGQPFIEEARASDGRAEFGRILERFSFWIYGQMGSLPKFDMAIAVTNARLEWGGGLAYMRGACGVDHGSRRHWGTLVWNDDGGWGSLTVGAHEIGHNVGAPHDDDPNFPGGCQDRGYIMSGGNDDLKWFFSTCSDRTIGEFVRSNEASCLRRLDETSQSPAISPDFSSVAAPSTQEQCRRRLNNPNAFTREEDAANCKAMKCWLDNGNGWTIWTMAPVDNTPCQGGGRCFRGRCRKIGRVLMNVGSGQCARAQNPFGSMTPIEMIPCPSPTQGATPLERFVLEDSSSNGRFLNTPYSTPDAKENGDKCIYTGNSDGDGLWTDKCNYDNAWQGWNLQDQGNGEFLLQHRVSNRCARASGSYVRSYGCNRNDASFRWRFI